jgi:flagella basal body P-ring formation protein FlgA
MLKPKATILPLAIAALLALSPALRGQLVRLEKQVTVDPRTDVRLGDIATISAADPKTAEVFSNTVILSAIDTNRTLKAESILLALMSQRGAQAMTNLHISGSAQCAITLRTPSDPQPAAALPSTKTASLPTTLSPAPIELPPVITASVIPSPPPPPPHPTLSTPATPSTELLLQHVIEARIQQEAAATGEKLRITIDSIAPQLTAPVAQGRRWICRPLSRTLLGTVNFEAQLTDGTRVIERLNVQTKVERQQQVVVSRTKLDRGDILTPGSVRVEETWLDRNLPTLASSENQVLGLETIKAVGVGTLLDTRDFRPALMATRGDPINVIFLSGNLKVQMNGRALQDGKMHEQITLRNEQTGDTYQATLIGKRLAVVGGTLSEADEQKLRETR